MKRHKIAPRSHWIDQVEKLGFTFHTHGKKPELSNSYGCYWDESVAYEFTLEEVETIEDATQELHRLCLEAVDYISLHPSEMNRFQIPTEFHDYVIQSWKRQDPYFYGRFDLAYDPNHSNLKQPKLLEYNADTPTLAIETALVQWFWLQDIYPDCDQYNSLHEKMIQQWRSIGKNLPPNATIYFSSILDEAEESQQTHYFMELAIQAGFKVKYIEIKDIGWNSVAKKFVDLDNLPIHYWFKLYPWEWLLQEEFGKFLLYDRIKIVEPAWKMLLSNKAILPLLWKLFPNHPHLLPAYWEKDKLTSYVAKPILGREGANIELVSLNNKIIHTTGTYGNAPMIYQATAPLPQFDSHYLVIGAWMIGNHPAGMILREDENMIIHSQSRIVPHFIS